LDSKGPALVANILLVFLIHCEADKIPIAALKSTSLVACCGDLEHLLSSLNSFRQNLYTDGMGGSNFMWLDI
jgi:hypothetical protein